MTAKTILVSGATDGIGRETARQLLGLGHRVLVHGRSREQAEAAAAQLARAPARETPVPVWGDLSRMREITALAQQVRGQCKMLDVLINNAGVLEKRQRMSEDGFEMTMAVNHFAVFQLTRLLLDLVQAANAGRIVTVSSVVHGSGKLDLDAPSFLRAASAYSGYDAYCASKLANVLFTTELAHRLDSGKVTANCLHPGVIGTKLLRSGFAMGGSPVEQGARTPVFLATSDAVAGISGNYYNNCREAQCSAAARDPALARALWQATEAGLRAFAH
jgi:NAD(P)-dependent dehydrogenase (short-subunit alcohol dehydrogenase family)